MRAAQRVRVKGRGRLLAVVVAGYKQPHLGSHQVSSNLNMHVCGSNELEGAMIL